MNMTSTTVTAITAKITMTIVTIIITTMMILMEIMTTNSIYDDVYFSSL
jgi:hypothetical protein